MAQLQVMGGELRGRRLHAARDIRPTTGRVREALFSILGDVSGARVLDLFCGSGALGIEALSRGAASATLVDTDVREATRNVEELGLGERATAVRTDAVRFLEGATAGSFELVLCDPPYRLADRLAGDLDPLVRRALAPGGRAVVESDPKHPMELTLPVRIERRYGDTMLRVHARDDKPAGGPR
jgi:16S rRNA (guanine(966)-N(2))-methyltransferase RsmD